jgi:hypothetical protein
VTEAEERPRVDDAHVLVAPHRCVVVPRHDAGQRGLGVRADVPFAVQVEPGAECRQVQPVGVDGHRSGDLRVGALSDEDDAVEAVERHPERLEVVLRRLDASLSRAQTARTARCGSARSSTVTASPSTRRTPRRECHSSTRAASDGAACGVVAWANPPASLGERTSRYGASIAVSSGRGARGRCRRGRHRSSGAITRPPAPTSLVVRLTALSIASSARRVAARRRRQGPA